MPLYETDQEMPKNQSVFLNVVFLHSAISTMLKKTVFDFYRETCDRSEKKMVKTNKLSEEACYASMKEIFKEIEGNKNDN